MNYLQKENNMGELDFSLATTEEIIKELAKRAKNKRQKNKQRYGSQENFAKHIGMKHRSYQEFEIKGQISLENFIKVLRGLDSLEDVEKVLSTKDEDLFKRRDQSKPHNSLPQKKPSVKNEKEIHKTDIDIPDVFGR